MNRRNFVASAIAYVARFSAVARLAGQKKTVEPDLVALVTAKSLKVSNRSISVLTDGTKKGVRLGENPDDGVAYLPGIEFANGVIEFDVRGRDVLQKSFLGIAFHGLDDKTCDIVYFRPFNFKSEDPIRRGHAVQYIAPPTYTWQKLRTEHPGQYEQPVHPVPDPNDWFHARIVVVSPKISVFVNDAKEPSLVVDKLSDRKTGMIGLWVGSDSGGDFANLKIIHDK